MDSLQITTSEKRITINGDPERVIVFNPADVMFAERFYKLMDDFQEQFTQYGAKAEEIESNQELDANGIPVNVAARIELLKEMCQYMRGQIDVLFGEGTSQKAFGNALELGMFEQFFGGITPFVQTVRKEKIAKYVNPATKHNGHKPKRGKK
jgi:hypothetical protein